MYCLSLSKMHVHVHYICVPVHQRTLACILHVLPLHHNPSVRESLYTAVTLDVRVHYMYCHCTIIPLQYLLAVYEHTDGVCISKYHGGECNCIHFSLRNACYVVHTHNINIKQIPTSI